MKFAPKELCKKLIKMGCKSDHFGYQNDRLIHYSNGPRELLLFGEIIPAFTLEDFVGTHEQAKENAKIVWGDDGKYRMNNPKKEWVLVYDFHRHKIIDSDDWTKYLKETIK